MFVRTEFFVSSVRTTVLVAVQDISKVPTTSGFQMFDLFILLVQANDCSKVVPPLGESSLFSNSFVQSL